MFFAARAAVSGSMIFLNSKISFVLLPCSIKVIEMGSSRLSSKDSRMKFPSPCLHSMIPSISKDLKASLTEVLLT